MPAIFRAITKTEWPDKVGCVFGTDIRCGVVGPRKVRSYFGKFLPMSTCVL